MREPTTLYFGGESPSLAVFCILHPVSVYHRPFGASYS